MFATPKEGGHSSGWGGPVNLCSSARLERLFTHNLAPTRSYSSATVAKQEKCARVSSPCTRDHHDARHCRDVWASPDLDTCPWHIGHPWGWPVSITCWNVVGIAPGTTALVARSSPLLSTRGAFAAHPQPIPQQGRKQTYSFYLPPAESFALDAHVALHILCCALYRPREHHKGGQSRSTGGFGIHGTNTRQTHRDRTRRSTAYTDKKKANDDPLTVGAPSKSKQQYLHSNEPNNEEKRKTKN